MKEQQKYQEDPVSKLQVTALSNDVQNLKSLRFSHFKHMYLLSEMFVYYYYYYYLEGKQPLSTQQSEVGAWKWWFSKWTQFSPIPAW